MSGFIVEFSRYRIHLAALALLPPELGEDLPVHAGERVALAPDDGRHPEPLLREPGVEQRRRVVRDPEGPTVPDVELRVRGPRHVGRQQRPPVVHRRRRQSHSGQPATTTTESHTFRAYKLIDHLNGDGGVQAALYIYSCYP